MNFDRIEVVLDKLIRTFKLKDHQYNIEDLAEDAAEAMKLIGAARNFGEAMETLLVESNTVKLPNDLEHLISVEPNYIRETGSFLEVDAPDGTEIRVIYQRLPVDSRGYPLIPDNAAVREAVMWYLAKNLILGGAIKTIPYQMAEAEWQWRCGSARADLNVMGMKSWAKVASDFRKLNTNSSVSNSNVDILLDREKNRLNGY